MTFLNTVRFIIINLIFITSHLSIMSQEEAIEQLNQTLIPLKTVEASNGFDDLQPLKETLKDAQIVGLGEATHGTSEFFKAKHRMLEFLVTEMGYRAIVMEDSYANAMIINRYVLGESARLDSLMMFNLMRPWATEEVRSMVEWMRTYNQTVTHTNKIYFLGCDMQYFQAPVESLIDYLMKRDLVSPTLTANIEKTHSFSLSQSSKAEKKQMAKIMEAITSEVNESLSTLPAASSIDEQLIRYNVRILEQCADFMKMQVPWSSMKRDRYMAENINKLSQVLQLKLVVWAHNMHIAKGSGEYKKKTMGMHLSELWGKKYYALGFGFNQGQFAASNSQTRSLEVFDAPPTRYDASDAFFAKAHHPNFIIDFRNIKENTALAPFIHDKTVSRTIGGSYNPEQDSSRFYYKQVLSKQYDGLIFIRTTTASKILDYQLFWKWYNENQAKEANTATSLVNN